MERLMVVGRVQFFLDLRVILEGRYIVVCVRERERDREIMREKEKERMKERERLRERWTGRSCRGLNYVGFYMLY